MDRIHRAIHVGLLAILLGAASAALAIEAGRTAGGEPYLIGGVGQEESAMLDLARDQFNLSVLTAVRDSGEYLADVRVRVVDADGRLVFDRELSGPELLIRLAPGRYALEAASHGEVHRNSANVDARGRREVIFYFRARAD